MARPQELAQVKLRSFTDQPPRGVDLYRTPLFYPRKLWSSL